MGYKWDIYHYHGISWSRMLDTTIYIHIYTYVINIRDFLYNGDLLLVSRNKKNRIFDRIIALRYGKLSD